jgi:hypothetical protein
MLQPRTGHETAPLGPGRAPLEHALVWQIVGLALAVRAGLWFAGASSVALHGKHPWLGMWSHWDGSHFVSIIKTGYERYGHRAPWIVFPPAYPYLGKAVDVVVRNPIGAALVVSFAASVGAGWLLYRVAELDRPPDEAWRAVVLLFCFPTAYFLAAPYAESVFLLGVLGAMYAARTDRWPLAGAFGTLAAASRLPGFVIVPALVVEAFRSSEDRARKLVWAALSGVGTLVFLATNWIVAGSPFRFVQIEKGTWHQRTVWPWDSLIDAVKQLPHAHLREWYVLVYPTRLLTAAFAIGVLAWGWKRLRPAERVYSWGSLAVCLSASRLISLPRYLLPIYPITSVLANRSGSRRVYTSLVVGGLALQTVLFVRYVNGQWAF